MLPAHPADRADDVLLGKKRNRELLESLYVAARLTPLTRAARSAAKPSTTS